MPGDEVGWRLLREYGALFAARGVAVPDFVVFEDAAAVSAFQSSVVAAEAAIGGINIELQRPALEALEAAVAEAAAAGLTITPRGEDAARRVYADTVALWKSRIEPALDHWTGADRITADVAKRIRALPPFDQVAEVFELEKQGIFFSKDLSKSIIYSVAPPGASQHLAMLALDVAEFNDAGVRGILARRGWYQTVVSDLPHFTYLGLSEDELQDRGLKSVTNAGRVFWVPDL
jgi:hypothetical protein